MKSAITPSTEPLLELFYQALTDDEPEVKSNAAFATGLLVEHTTVDLSPQFMHLLQALRPFFQINADATNQQKTARDNAAGAVSRMLTRNSTTLPLDQVLPILYSALPLRNDYVENKAVFKGIFHLFRTNPNALVPYIDTLLPVFAHVLDPATTEEQLNDETRSELLNLVTALNREDTAKVQAAGLGVYVQGA